MVLFVYVLYIQYIEVESGAEIRGFPDNGPVGTTFGNNYVG